MTNVCVFSLGAGFDMMEAFGLTPRAHSSVEGVVAEPFIFNTRPTYSLYRDIQLTQSTKWDSRVVTTMWTKIILWISNIFFFVLLLLQVYPSCRILSWTYHQHRLPCPAGHPQGTFLSVAAHRQRLPAKDGSHTWPWVTSVPFSTKSLMLKS